MSQTIPSPKELYQKILAQEIPYWIKLFQPEIESSISNGVSECTVSTDETMSYYVRQEFKRQGYNIRHNGQSIIISWNLDL